jgi:ClpP class serine protease
MNLELMAYLTDPNRLWAIDVSHLLRFKAAADAYTGAPLEARDSGAPSRTANNVAVIDISGPISPRPTIFTALFGGTAISSIQASFRQALADDSVRAIVLAFDTPGGEVAGVSDLAAEIQAGREKKTVVSQIVGLGASAGYWLASAAQRIVATKDSRRGDYAR